jgi:hypothetical protein
MAARRDLYVPGGVRIAEATSETTATSGEQIEEPTLAVRPIDPVDIGRASRVQRVEHDPATQIFTQGNPATSVMYVEKGAARLSVLSHAGKEARRRGARRPDASPRGFQRGPEDWSTLRRLSRPIEHNTKLRAFPPLWAAGLSPWGYHLDTASTEAVLI